MNYTTCGAFPQLDVARKLTALLGEFFVNHLTRVEDMERATERAEKYATYTGNDAGTVPGRERKDFWRFFESQWRTTPSKMQR
jgi:hypothetical protein